MQPLKRRPTPLLHHLLLASGVLFGGAVLLAAVGPAILLPSMESPTQAALSMAVLVVLDLLLVFLFGGLIVRRLLLRPMQALAEDVRRIQEGDYGHRIQEASSLELEQLRQGVNAMADRLIADQIRLAENIESLDRTNEELVEARNQVIRSARLASVGTLSAGIAHELGNPLGAVIAYVDVAKRRVLKAGEDPEILDSIREEAGRIDRIVRSLLEYARPREAELGPVHPREVAVRVRRLLESQGRLDGVDDEWDVDSPVPLVVMEAHQMEQVLVNLLLNALDALEGRDDRRIRLSLSSEHGGITRLPRRREGDPPGVNYLHRRRVSKDEGGRGIDPLFTAREVVVVTVEDNGAGIPVDDQERIFDPFFTTKEPGKGTGLGLSICARLVEGMGGHIEVGNRDGGGARFVIRLPALLAEVRDADREGVTDSGAAPDEPNRGGRP